MPVGQIRNHVYYLPEIGSSIPLKRYKAHLHKLHADSSVKNNKLLSKKYFKKKSDGIFYVTLCLQTTGEFLTEDNIKRCVERMETSVNELGPSGDMELENIMDMPDHGSPTDFSSEVLLLGGPGTGKTTISQTLSYRWGIRELWDEKYDFVFHLTCRKLKEDCKTETSILQLLIKHHPTQENIQEELYQHIKSYADRILVIIDGLDELEGWALVVEKHKEVVEKHKQWIMKLEELFEKQKKLNKTQEKLVQEQQELGRIQKKLAEEEMGRKQVELDKRQEAVVKEQLELGKIQKELAEKRKELDEELEKVTKEREVNKQKELDEKKEEVNKLQQEVSATQLEVEEGQKEVNDGELELVEKPMEMIQKLKDMINKQKKLDEKRNELDKKQKEFNENENEITNHGKPTIQTKHPVPELIFNLAFGLMEEKVEVLLTSRPIESIAKANFRNVLYALGFNEDAIDECSFAMCKMKESEQVGKQKEGTEKKKEVAEKQNEEAETPNEEAEKQNDEAEKQNEDAEKQNEEAEKQNDVAEKQNEVVGKQIEEAEKQNDHAHETVEKQSEKAEKQNEKAEKLNEVVGKQIEEVEKQNEKAEKQKEEPEKQNGKAEKQKEEPEKQNEKAEKQKEEPEKQNDETGKQNEVVVNKHADLMKLIREKRPALYYLCVVPLNCVLLWSHLLEDKDSITSLTDLSLSKVIACVHSRDDHQYNYELESKQRQLLKLMAKLAFTQFNLEKFIFNKSDLEKHKIDVKDAKVSNLMEIHGSNTNDNDSIQASFTHLTIQEFLAAVHVCLTWEEKNVKKVATVNPGSRRLDNVQLYTAGLLGDKKNGHKFLQALDERDGDMEHLYQEQASEYVTSMIPPGEELSSLTKLQMIRCAHEGRMPKMIEEVAKAVLKVTNEDPYKGGTIDKMNILDLSKTAGGLLPHHLVSIQYFVQESLQVEGLR